LKAFERVSVAAGATKTVTFTLTPESFRMWNIEMHRVVEPGAFELMVGPSSVDLKTAVLHIGG
jgi:beta-glucosidase